MTNEVMEQSRDEVEYGKLYHPQKDVKVIKKEAVWKDLMSRRSLMQSESLHIVR